MPTNPGDHNAAPTNSTFSSRAAERAGKPPKPPRRRTTLRAGIDAETDFTITHRNERTNVVRPIST